MSTYYEFLNAINEPKLAESVGRDTSRKYIKSKALRDTINSIVKEYDMRFNLYLKNIINKYNEEGVTKFDKFSLLIDVNFLERTRTDDIRVLTTNLIDNIKFDIALRSLPVTLIDVVKNKDGKYNLVVELDKDLLNLDKKN